MSYQPPQTPQDTPHHNTGRPISPHNQRLLTSAAHGAAVRTPNDLLLLHRTRPPRPDAREKKVTTTKLKNVFLNFRERDELMTACAKGDVDKVSYILEHTKPRVDPDMVRDSKLRTPLLVACAAGNADVVKLLIQWGADVNHPIGDIVGNKPLDLAVISNNFETVLALLEAGAHISSPGQSNISDGAAPLPTLQRVRSRTPLDLAQSRLDMMIQQREQRAAAMETDHANAGFEGRESFMEHICQIIQILKYFANKRQVAPSPSRMSDSDTLNELEFLTSKLSAVDINGTGQSSKSTAEEDLEVMKGLRDVISKLKI